MRGEKSGSRRRKEEEVGGEGSPESRASQEEV